MIEKVTMKTNSMQTSGTNAVTCPYCGYENPDSEEYEMGPGEVRNVTCPGCGRAFSVECEITVDYDSKPINPDGTKARNWDYAEKFDYDTDMGGEA